MRKLIIFIILILECSISAIGQDTSYYDSNWRLTDKVNSTYYYISIPFIKKSIYSKQRIINKSDSALLIEHLNKTIIKMDFSHSLVDDSVLLGKQIKIYDTGNLYSSLYYSDSNIDWPSEEIRLKSGNNYRKWKYPVSGDYGAIIWVFKKFSGQTTGDKVYIIETDKGYSVLGGLSLTMVDKPCYSELYKESDTIPAPKIENEIVFSVGAFFQKEIFGEFNIMLAKYTADVGGAGTGYYGPRIGVETNFNDVIAPKIGYDVDLFPITFRLSAIGYIHGGSIDYRLLPEVGINIVYASITVGYNMYLFGYNNSDYSGLRISIRATVPLSF